MEPATMAAEQPPAQRLKRLPASTSASASGRRFRQTTLPFVALTKTPTTAAEGGGVGDGKAAEEEDGVAPALDPPPPPANANDAAADGSDDDDDDDEVPAVKATPMVKAARRRTREGQLVAWRRREAQAERKRRALRRGSVDEAVQGGAGAVAVRFAPRATLAFYPPETDEP